MDQTYLKILKEENGELELLLHVCYNSSRLLIS